MRKAQQISKRVLIISVILFVLSMVTVMTFAPRDVNLSGGEEPEQNPLQIVIANSAIITLFCSVLTGLTSFATFVITSIIAFRKDKREEKEAALGREAKRVAIDKEKIELEMLRKKYRIKP